MAITTRFNLKIFQYNVINVFINTPLNKIIYIRTLIKYKEKRESITPLQNTVRIKKITFIIVKAL